MQMDLKLSVSCKGIEDYEILRSSESDRSKGRCYSSEESSGAERRKKARIEKEFAIGDISDLNSGYLRRDTKERLRKFLAEPGDWLKLRKQSKMYYEFSEALRLIRENNSSDILEMRSLLRNNPKITAKIIRMQSRPVLQILAYVLSEETSITASKVSRLIEICLQSGHWQESPKRKVLQLRREINSLDSAQEIYEAWRTESNCAIKEESPCFSFQTSSLSKTDSISEKSLRTLISECPEISRENSMEKLLFCAEQMGAQIFQGCKVDNSWRKENDNRSKENIEKCTAENLAKECRDDLYLNQLLKSDTIKTKLKGLENSSSKINSLKHSVTSARNYAAFILKLHNKLQDRLGKLNSISQSLEYALSEMKPFQELLNDEIINGNIRQAQISSSATKEDMPSITSNAFDLNSEANSNFSAAEMVNKSPCEQETMSDLTLLGSSSLVNIQNGAPKDPNAHEENIAYFHSDIQRENLINEENTKVAFVQVSEIVDYLEKAIENARFKIVSSESALRLAEQYHEALK